ncbi:unnamed protein product, partial [Urochloa humidicola]
IGYLTRPTKSRPTGRSGVASNEKRGHQCQYPVAHRVDRANPSLILHATRGERAAGGGGGCCCCSVCCCPPPASPQAPLSSDGSLHHVMSRPGTEAGKQAAAVVPHTSPAPAPVPAISTRRISPRAAISSIQSRLRLDQNIEEEGGGATWLVSHETTTRVGR